MTATIYALPIRTLPRSRLSRGRDSQRARVYKSDAVLVEIAKPLPEVVDVKRYVKRVTEMKRVRDAFPRARLDSWKIDVTDGRGRRSSYGCHYGIGIIVAHRNEAIVLHELAHTITCRMHGDVPAHGWQFAHTYLSLVLYAMGREAHDVLKAAFKENRVRFRPKRILSEDQKLAAAERLAAYRQQKAAAE